MTRGASPVAAWGTLRPSTPVSHDELVRDRRHLHAHPELGFEEHETAAFIAERLRSFGLEVQTGVGRESSEYFAARTRAAP
jgi:metal-dependent amidase/aminoacylase/carboxypeptidase family protein